MTTQRPFFGAALALLLASSLLYAGNADAKRRIKTKRYRAACPAVAEQTPEQAQACQRVRVRYLKSGSAETTAERERRLKRECRGQNNAGACLGYTR